MDSDGHDLLLPLVTEENICLPLPINVVAKYWNVEIPMAEAQEIAKRYAGARGSILIEGIELAERHGLESKVTHSDVSTLRRLIDMGIPPIVILPGVQDTIQHASVISGYDPDDKTILHYVPKMEKDGAFHVGVIPEQKFDQNWSEDGRLMIILAPSDITDKLESYRHEKSNRLCLESEKFGLTGNPQRSTELLNEALSIDPDNHTAHLLLGSALNDQNSSDCIRHYERCIELNKKFIPVIQGTGKLFSKDQAVRTGRTVLCRGNLNQPGTIRPHIQESWYCTPRTG